MIVLYEGSGMVVTVKLGTDINGMSSVSLFSLMAFFTSELRRVFSRFVLNFLSVSKSYSL